MPAPHVGRASLYCQPLTAGQAVKQITAACTGVDRSISVKRPAASWNNCRYSDLLPTRGWCQPLADLRLRACSGWHWAGGRNRVRTSDPWVVRYARVSDTVVHLGLRAGCGLLETGGIGCGCGQAWWSALVTMGCAPAPRCELAPGWPAGIVQEGRWGVRHCGSEGARSMTTAEPPLVHDARASWHGHARALATSPDPARLRSGPGSPVATADGPATPSRGPLRSIRDGKQSGPRDTKRGVRQTRDGRVLIMGWGPDSLDQEAL